MIVLSRCRSVFWAARRQLACSGAMRRGCWPMGRVQTPMVWPSGGVSRLLATEAAVDDVERQHRERRDARTVRSINYLFFGMCGVFLGAVGYVVVVKGAPMRDENGDPVEDKFSSDSFLRQRVRRAWNEVSVWYQGVREPSRKKLLPDPPPPGYISPKYTLVLELTGVLVHPEWTYDTGWRFKVRPAVEHFLRQVGFPNFEVVVFTAESGFTAMPLIDQLDPQQNRIMHRLYRDTTNYIGGHHVKDLSYLNRDLSKVILLDWDPKSFQLHPQNALCLPRWLGDDQDTSLVDLAELLKTILLSDVEDVRPVLEYYGTFSDPAKEFRERSKQLQESQASSSEQQQSHSLAKGYAGKLFGFRRHSGV